MDVGLELPLLLTLNVARGPEVSGDFKHFLLKVNTRFCFGLNNKILT